MNIFYSSSSLLNTLFLLFSCLMINTSAFSEESERYWIIFQDKCDTEKLDFFNQSVCQNYLDSLNNIGFQEETVSNWLNAVTVDHVSKSDAKYLKSLSFIKEVRSVNTQWKLGVTSTEETLKEQKQQAAYAIKQLKPDPLYEEQLNGEGVAVGVIDAGFWNAKKNDYLKKLFDEGRVKGFRDFITPDRHETSFYFTKETGSDSHGTTVLRMIAGKEGNMRYGLADHSSFYLARTDHGDSETRTDEENWIAALEWMVDSLQVKLINSSLGYTNGFDDPSDNYSPKEMDGKTSMVTQAAEYAVENKGVLLILSAGNEGDNNAWKVISAPADAKGVLSVGATTKSGSKASYSSIGPKTLPYVKPEVSCYSLFGTSFSAPVITGLAACLWQYQPEASAEEIKEAIIESSSLYPYANNYIGYGVPDAGKAMQLLKEEKPKSAVKELKATGKKKITLEAIPEEHSMAVLFHKKENTIVIKQEFIYLERDSWKIKKVKKAESTTLWTGKRHIEVFW
ncbi:S8 family serine peptidase [Flammeovirga sp. SubArs3]|uniref:S8 family serine peptidase n=1 Tax=Flammeovirga sp. SubArs3 TaxID=2995316 RepID=UPI00248C2D0B|nr:S8 family serine peptidase [Flammeovirga sp. SubArs3]